MRTVLVCTNVDCLDRGATEVLRRFDELDAEGRLPKDVEVREYLCFSACQKGPNVVVAEDHTWYCGVTKEDVEDICVQHLTGGQVVDHLTREADTITANLIFCSLDAGVLPGEL